MSYELLDQDGGQAIRCLLCGTVSDAAVDVLQRYCPRCNRYHERELELMLISIDQAIRHARPDLDLPGRFSLAARILLVLAPGRGGARGSGGRSHPIGGRGGVG